MIALLIAAVGFTAIAGPLLAVLCWPRRPTTYTTDHVRPLDRYSIGRRHRFE